MKLELTEVTPVNLLDPDTQDAILGGRMTREIIEMNIDVFKGEVIQVGGVAFAITETEGRMFLHPFRINVGIRQYKYAFIAYVPQEKALYWFFKGISKTQNRAEAFKIYDALVDYCKGLPEKTIPLLIKR